jgi:methionyl-tRNA formyltransferase
VWLQPHETAQQKEGLSPGPVSSMNIIFCGTPEFAVPTLRAVHAAGHNLALVVTQPDRPAGRGLTSIAPPVKLTALDLGLPPEKITQPETIRNNANFHAQLEAIAPDVILVVAYGRIIPQWMLDLPPHGNINLHASLLPKYRGAAPIQWAIASGERVTGNTTMRIDAGLDTGGILLQQTIPIPPIASTLELYPTLATSGAELMLRTLEGLAAGTLQPTPQDNTASTLAPILTKEDGRINFNRNAVEIVNRWRGFQPWPGAYTTLHGKKLSLIAMHSSTESAEDTAPGAVIDASPERSEIRIACGQGSVLVVTALQLEGRKRMQAADFLRGANIQSGEQLG